MKIMKMAVFASGGGTNFQCLIDNIKSGKINAEIVLLVASNAEAYAIKRAEANNIPVFVAPLKNYPCGNCRDRAVMEKLAEAGAEYIFLCGYLGILSAALVRQYNNKIVNIHPSLLPKYGGKGMHGIKVHEEVLRNKEKITGATVHFVDEGTDTGQIIMQKSVDILENDTPETLQQRVLEQCEHIILPEVAKALSDGRIKLVKDKVIIKS